jgi:hypothetical protein
MGQKHAHFFRERIRASFEHSAPYSWTSAILHPRKTSTGVPLARASNAAIATPSPDEQIGTGKQINFNFSRYLTCKYYTTTRTGSGDSFS